MAQDATQTQKINGVDVTRLGETIESIKDRPQLAEFHFRVTNRWQDAGHNRSQIQNFYGAGEEDTSRKQAFVLDADEPCVLLGTDKAANPVEYLLHALAACVTTSMVYHASARGIHIEEVQSRVEGDLDLHGFLGMDDAVPRGYQSIRMFFRIQADVPEDQLQELCQLGPTFSPVFDTLSRKVNVEVELDR